MTFLLEVNNSRVIKTNQHISGNNMIKHVCNIVIQCNKVSKSATDFFLHVLWQSFVQNSEEKASSVVLVKCCLLYHCSTQPHCGGHLWAVFWAPCHHERPGLLKDKMCYINYFLWLWIVQRLCRHTHTHTHHKNDQSFHVTLIWP